MKTSKNLVGNGNITGKSLQWPTEFSEKLRENPHLNVHTLVCLAQRDSLTCYYSHISHELPH
jgi:hypothetical protein